MHRLRHSYPPYQSSIEDKQSYLQMLTTQSHTFHRLRLQFQKYTIHIYHILHSKNISLLLIFPSHIYLLRYSTFQNNILNYNCKYRIVKFQSIFHLFNNYKQFNSNYINPYYLGPKTHWFSVSAQVHSYPGYKKLGKVNLVSGTQWDSDSSSLIKQ